MTHHEALAGNQSGLPPSSCPGELSREGVYKDRHLGRDGYTERVVTVWRCTRCEAVIPISEGFTLNAYHPIVCALAEKFEAGPVPPGNPGG